MGYSPWNHEELDMTEQLTLSLSLGHSEEQRSLACCSLWGHQESDTTERLNNSNVPLSYTLTHGHGGKFCYLHLALKVSVAQLCPTLCNPMHCTVHEILQARILENG